MSGRVETGRLAPSPTGGLHLGHARTFLIAWLAARRQGGRVVLRMEDIDATRVRAEALTGMLDDLAWLGLDWDEGPDVGGPHAPYYQSQRLDLYAEALERLKAAGLVYPCTCTRSDIARAASAPHAGDEGPVYPGTCAGRTIADAERFLAEGRPFAWRFRCPAGPIAWDDEFLGPQYLDLGRIGGDFVVARSPAAPAYQLAVVCDDAAMGITQVMRGDDLVPSTPRQIVLYRALRYSLPRFAHVPLVHGPDGRRLAKRDDSIKLAALRLQGMDPRRLVGLLGQACGWSDRVEPSKPRDWIERFDWSSLPRAPWTIDASVFEAC